MITTITFALLLLMGQEGFNWLPYVQISEEVFFWLFRGLGGLGGFILVYYRDTYVSYVLSFRIMRFIGRQSYCAYVWHFSYLVLMDKIGLDWLRPCYMFLGVICGVF